MKRFYAYVQLCHCEVLLFALLPVCIGFSLAADEGPIDYFLGVLTVLFAVSIQVFNNVVDELVDFTTGNAYRGKLGFPRPLVDGRLTPRDAFRVITVSGGLAMLFGTMLVYLCLPWSVFPLLLVPAAAWAYTGEPMRLGYRGYGELAVFLLFGPIATAGTFWLQRGYFSGEAVAAAILSGLVSVSVLTVHNLRDLRVDEFCRKKTLAVVFGRGFSVSLFAVSGVISACLLGWLTDWVWMLPILLFTFLTTRELGKEKDPSRINELLNQTVAVSVGALFWVVFYLVKDL